MAEVYDVLVVGAGVAGLSAAMYAGRFRLKTAVVGEVIGGAITLTNEVENYPGFVKITGAELIERLREQALRFGAEIFLDKVIEIRPVGKNCFRARTEGGRAFTAKAVILATGTQRRQLGVPGEQEFSGKGVSYCALCDGAFFRGKTVGVVGGGDGAVKEALVLAEYADKVYIFARGDRLRAEPINLERLSTNKKIEVVLKIQIKEIRGDTKVRSVVFDRPLNGKTEMALDGLFIEIGHVPASGLASALGVRLNEKGEIVIDREGRTNVPGVFAAGDVCDTKFKQAATSASEGVAAAYSAYQYVSEGKFACDAWAE
ncbi:MAG: FAD-dependent oxidoreductase [Candidatus Micrarchaeia archaeon]